MHDISNFMRTRGKSIGGEAQKALEMIAGLLEENNGSLTLCMDGTVQHIDLNDIFIGSSSIRLRNMDLNFSGLKLSAFPGHESSLSTNTSHGVCVLSYNIPGANELALAMIYGRPRGIQIMKAAAIEAIDSIATQAMNCQNNIMITRNNDNTFTSMDPSSMTVSDEGIHVLTAGTMTWNSIIGISSRDALVIAHGNNELLTINEMQKESSAA